MGTLKCANEVHAISKKVLARLLVNPMRQHEVCEYLVKNEVSIKRATTVFYWLRNSGHIRKISKSYCSPFEITEKGKMLLKALEF